MMTLNQLIEKLVSIQNGQNEIDDNSKELKILFEDSNPNNSVLQGVSHVRVYPENGFVVISAMDEHTAASMGKFDCSIVYI